MNENLIALKLMLDELGVEPHISTLDDRKRVQKAVYLGQVAGVPLGYQFGWYLLGPYSPSLTRDYFQLAEELEAGDTDLKGKTFRDTVAKKLKRIAPMLNAPKGWTLGREAWLELLASYHYLRTVSGVDHQRAIETMSKQKPHLVLHADTAKSKLETYDLLAA